MMHTPTTVSILAPGAKLEALVLDPKNPSLLQRFAVTRQRQKAILKLKEVDPKSLQLVVRL
jgi:hypothetical protein